MGFLTLHWLSVNRIHWVFVWMHWFSRRILTLFCAMRIRDTRKSLCGSLNWKWMVSFGDVICVTCVDLNRECWYEIRGWHYAVLFKSFLHLMHVCDKRIAIIDTAITSNNSCVIDSSREYPAINDIVWKHTRLANCFSSMPSSCFVKAYQTRQLFVKWFYV